MNEVNPYEAPASEVGGEEEFDEDLFAGGGQLAGRGTRLGAKIIDSMAFMVPAFFFGFMGSGLNASGSGVVVVGILLLFGAVIGLNLYWLHDNGQTIGKRALDVRIVRSDRRSDASLWRILLARGLPVAVLSSLPCVGSIFSVTDACFIFRDDRRCIHDHIADTVVVIDGTVPGSGGGYEQKYLDDAEMETFEEMGSDGPETSEEESFDDASQQW